MNYWFLYNLTNGNIHGAPYLGYADEWTNIPDGCGVLGPFEEKTAPNEVKQAFVDPMSYKVIGGQFIYEQYIAPPQPIQPKTPLELLQEKVAINQGAIDFIINNF